MLYSANRITYELTLWHMGFRVSYDLKATRFTCANLIRHGCYVSLNNQAAGVIPSQTKPGEHVYFVEVDVVKRYVKNVPSCSYRV